MLPGLRTRTAALPCTWVTAGDGSSTKLLGRINIATVRPLASANIHRGLRPKLSDASSLVLSIGNIPAPARHFSVGLQSAARRTHPINPRSETLKQLEDEVAKAEAEYQKVKAAAEKARTEALLWMFFVGALGLSAFVLWGEWLWNGQDDVLQWRVKRRLEKGPKEGSIPKCPPPEISGSPMFSLRPYWRGTTVLLGPDGSGKTTTLTEAAEYYRTLGAPVLFLSFRNPSSSRETPTDFNYAAQTFFNAIGYPSSPTLIRQLVSLFRGVAERQAEEERELIERFRMGITHLMEASSKLGFERYTEMERELEERFGPDWRKTNPEAGRVLANMTPLIIADDIDWLYGDPRGRRIANRFFAHLQYFEHHLFRCVATTRGGRHYSFSNEIEESDKFDRTEQDEPSPDQVKAALRAAGHSEEDVAKIFDHCGVRFGLLQRFLRRAPEGTGKAPQSIDALLEELMDEAERGIVELMDVPVSDEEDRHEIIRILDGLSLEKFSRSMFYLTALPEPYRPFLPSKVFYAGIGPDLHLHSQIVGKAWLRYKEKKMVQQSKKKSWSEWLASFVVRSH
jgi:hypothetical protein